MPARALGITAAVATLVVGVVHAINSFRGSTASLQWPKAGWFDETNESFSEAFLLTPYQIAKHWQPLLLGLIALGQHVRVVNVWRIYTNWLQAALWYLFLAFFGCLGFAGDLGIVAGLICLVAAFLSLCISCLDRSANPSSLTEPLFP
ncbi:hypothetical protein T492DRAFT_855116 [Pavlovales sp. CCMP2436]|nr:hypothetical protein T492DRAFT_855116 [Pavlovales sp. CCMP2436]